MRTRHDVRFAVAIDAAVYCKLTPALNDPRASGRLWDVETPHPMKRISMKDIAEAAGVSRMTVSYALRNAAKIPAGTKARIRALAEQMGYHPDPLIQRLSSHLAEARRSAFVGCIGYVTSDRVAGAWQHIPAYRRAFATGVERARQLGYRLEEFWVGAPGMTGGKLSRIMAHRGIQGVILAPVPGGVGAPALDWKRFSVVAMGYSLARLKVHRAVNHQLNTGIEAIKQAENLGYERISLCVEQDQNKRVNHAWEQALLFHQSRIPASRRIRPHLPETLSADKVLAWVKLAKPDCLLVHDLSICGWLRRAGYRVPEDVGVVLLDHDAELHREFAGMDQQHAQIGMACVEMVVAQIFRNERGLPEHPRTIMIDGTWTSGETAVPKR